MQTSFWKMMSWILTALATTLLLNACGSGSSSTQATTPTGTVNMDVTDAPAIDYAHVYVTVTGVAFHTDTSIGFDSYSSSKASGWQTVRLATPKTIDLAQLANGVMYADTNSGSSLFSGLALPAGTYRQIRIFLASTEDAYVGSMAGLTYNNEILLNGGSTPYPLRIATADEGIRLIPESPVVVTAGSSAKIALDFNLNNDIVKVSPNGSTEFILKPRLGYFDMGSVGAVKGTVIFGNLSTSRLVIKAEQVKPNANYRIARRWTMVDKTTGAFNLYPLPVFGNATTATYDILLRGRNVQTAIIKGVQVHKGTSLSSGAVDLGNITLQPGTEFTAQFATAMHPSGAWVNFYQTIAGDAIPYEVRYRHLDPYTGKFGTAMELSMGPIQVANYNPGQPLSFTPDATSLGSFSAVADAAGFYGRGAAMSNVTGSVGQAVQMANGGANTPQVTSPATASNITTLFDMGILGSGKGYGMGMGRSFGNPTKGQLFVTHGGMIIDSLGTLGGDTTVGNAMHSGGGQSNTVVMSNLPGGVAGAFYGMYALGWGNSVLAAGSTHVNLSSGNATSNVKMK